jgi:hypothetical protein
MHSSRPTFQWDPSATEALVDAIHASAQAYRTRWSELKRVLSTMRVQWRDFLQRWCDKQLVFCKTKELKALSKHFEVEKSRA